MVHRNSHVDLVSIVECENATSSATAITMHRARSLPRWRDGPDPGGESLEFSDDWGRRTLTCYRVKAFYMT